ncbi:MAG: hypothetical protein WCC21_19865 [Candidatus Acidiferrales bacterium]
MGSNPTLSARKLAWTATRGVAGELDLQGSVTSMTMELLLNLLWLLIAIALLCVWRTQWRTQRRGRDRRHLQEWSAVSLALVLLFFAVSMSDDLHSEIVALEESSASKRDSIHLSAAHPSVEPSRGHRQAHSPVSPRALGPGQFEPVGTVVVSQPAFQSPASYGRKPNRGPPVFLS